MEPNNSYTKELKEYLEYMRANKKTVCLAFCNRKGGVGKTAVSLSVAKTLANFDFNVCYLDSDGQQSATNILGINNAYENNPILNIRNISKESKKLREAQKEEYEIDDLYGEPDELELFKSADSGLHNLITRVLNNEPLDEETIKNAIIRPTMMMPDLTDEQKDMIVRKGLTFADLEESGIKFKKIDTYGFDLLPSSEEVTDDEMIIISGSTNDNHKYVLKKIVDAIKTYCNYDVIIIDCPPSMGVLSTNALYAADGLVLVGMPDKQSIYSVAKIKKAIRDNNINGATGGIVGFVLNAGKEDDVLFPIMKHYITEKLHIKFLDTLIFKSVNAPKASSTNLTFVQYDKKARPIYEELTKEILQSYFDMKQWIDRCENKMERQSKKLAESPLIFKDENSIGSVAVRELDEYIEKMYGIKVDEFKKIKPLAYEEAKKRNILKAIRKFINQCIKNGDVKWERRTNKYRADI